MADETWIDPEGAHHLLKEIEAVAGELRGAVTGVRSIRTNIPEPWGTDEHGDNFSKQREPNMVATVDAVDQAITFLEQFGDTGHRAVNNLVDQDRDNGAGLS